MERINISFRIPPDLHERLKAQAGKEERSINNLVVQMLRAALSTREKKVTQ